VGVCLFQTREMEVTSMHLTAVRRVLLAISWAPYTYSCACEQ
jgi:hypothetical protein